VRVTHFFSPIGTLEITESNDAIVSITFLDEVPNMQQTSLLLDECCKQLSEYFEGERKEFKLPLNPEGTEFQRSVWNLLQTIPFGQTVTYLEMAKRLGDPKVIRAAGTANGRNPIAIIIPCHRVIGSDGSLTGYAGGLARKQWLLEHESAQRSLF